jgi:UDP-N-acetylglucosamine 2-epimerase (non-hydrolysing)
MYMQGMTLPRIIFIEIVAIQREAKVSSHLMPERPFLLVTGARPNFMKVAPIAREMRKRKISYRLLHTGQHHDPALSDIFLKQLGLGRPHFSLGVGSGTHAQVTARVMRNAEPILTKLKPRAVVVVGDVNSTLAMAVTASKMHLPIVHVEAGLRSGDRMMPEETNRILTDVISDLLLTPSADADQNLKLEGISSERIARVGNVMIDSLKIALSKAPRTKSKSEFVLMTFHRPSNVDSKSGLEKLIRFLKQVSSFTQIELPLHPRTHHQLQKFGLLKNLQGIRGLSLSEPIGYFEFASKMRSASAVVTDSGGIQEETSYLGVPCLIMRTTTERPICITHGTAELMGENFSRAAKRLRDILRGKPKRKKKIPLWDGKTAKRIVSVLRARYQ